MLQRFEELKRQLTDLQAGQMALMAKVDHLVRTTAPTVNDVLPDDAKFPVDSLEKLDAIDVLLENPSHKQAIVSKFSFVCSDSCEGSVLNN
jgi:hypothetical protein